MRAWNSRLEAHLFDEKEHVKKILDALPNGSAITFSTDQLEVLFSGGGPVLADSKTSAITLDSLANTFGCSLALHGDTGTITKTTARAAASAQVIVPRPPIQIGFEAEKEDKMFGKSKGNLHEEDKFLPPVQHLQNLAPTHFAASDSAANSSIGPEMTVVGKLSSDGTVNVFGHVEGELHASIVWISDGGQVEGAIVAQELIIGGRFKGTIQADRVTLTSSAVVEGEIHHRSLAIEDNAWFAGVSRPAEASATGAADRQSLVPRDEIRQVNDSLVKEMHAETANG